MQAYWGREEATCDVMTLDGFSKRETLRGWMKRDISTSLIVKKT